MRPWYKDGLSFECTQCGGCCGGSPGVVWVDAEEIRRIAQLLKVAPDSLWGRVVRRVGAAQASLMEHANGDCVFLRRSGDGRVGCAIYPLRPQQCRTWPFWDQNLRSAAQWKAAASRPADSTRASAGTSHCGCPGMNRGRTFTLPEIEAVRLAPPWYCLPEDPPRDSAG